MYAPIVVGQAQQQQGPSFVLQVSKEPRRGLFGLGFLPFVFPWNALPAASGILAQSFMVPFGVSEQDFNALKFYNGGGTASYAPGDTATFTATLTDNGAGGPYDYSYDFNDGNKADHSAISATSDSVTHVYPNSGTYNPSVTVKDQLGATATASIKIVVSSAVSVSISPSSPSETAGASVTFTATVSGGTTPYSYVWYVTGGPSGASGIGQQSSTSSTMSFTFAQSGTYTVECDVADATNYQQKATATVTVYDKPSVTISAS